jgi:hypothetical protein
MKTLRRFRCEFEVFCVIDYVRALRAVKTVERRRRIAARTEMVAVCDRAAEREACILWAIGSSGGVKVRSSLPIRTSDDPGDTTHRRKRAQKWRPRNTVIFH